MFIKECKCLRFTLHELNEMKNSITETLNKRLLMWAGVEAKIAETRRLVVVQRMSE